MKLFNSNMSPYCSRVRGVLYAKGIDFTLVSDMKEAKKVNPIGKIPALQLDNGQFVFESEVINEYICNAFPNKGPNFMPKDPLKAAKSSTVSRIVDLYMSPHFSAFWTPKVSKDVIDKAVAELNKSLDIIEGMIEGPYICGNEMSLADWNLGVPMTTIFWQRKGYDCFKGRPKLAAWYAKLKENQAWLKMEDEILVAAKVRPAKSKM